MKEKFFRILKNIKKIHILLLIIVIIFVGLLFYKFNPIYSENIDNVRMWQNKILTEESVTFGEVMDYLLKDKKWKEDKYLNKKVVTVTGKYKSNNKEVVIHLNPDYDDEKIETMFVYYKEGKIEHVARDLIFKVSEYAHETSKKLGRK